MSEIEKNYYKINKINLENELDSATTIEKINSLIKKANDLFLPNNVNDLINFMNRAAMIHDGLVDDNNE